MNHTNFQLLAHLCATIEETYLTFGVLGCVKSESLLSHVEPVTSTARSTLKSTTQCLVSGVPALSTSSHCLHTKLALILSMNSKSTRMIRRTSLGKSMLQDLRFLEACLPMAAITDILVRPEDMSQGTSTFLWGGLVIE
jgi:hypothetical protein